MASTLQAPVVLIFAALVTVTCSCRAVSTFARRVSEAFRSPSSHWILCVKLQERAMLRRWNATRTEDSLRCSSKENSAQHHDLKRYICMNCGDVEKLLSRLDWEASFQKASAQTPVTQRASQR